MQARFGEDFQALAEGTGNVVLRLGTPSTFRALAAEAEALGRAPDRPRIRLVLGQPPIRPNQERLSFSYVGTAWVLGREAASLVPIEALLGTTARVPWGWQSAQIRRAYEAAAPILARDARAILILEPGGPEGLLAAVLGGVGAGYRLVAARLAEPGEETGGTVEFVPPGRSDPDRPANPGQRLAAGRARRSRATRTWSRAGACSRRRSDSTGADSRRPMSPGRSPRRPWPSSRPGASRLEPSACWARSWSGSIALDTSAGWSPRRSMTASMRPPRDDGPGVEDRTGASA